MLHLIPEWLRTALDIVASSDKRYVALAVAVYFFSVIIYAARIKIVMKWTGYRLALHHAAASYLMNIFVNNITPGARAGGEVVRALYIQRITKSPLATVVNAIAYERVTEAIAIVFLIFFTIAYSLSTFGHAGLLAAAALLIIGGLAAVYKMWDRLMLFLEERLRERNLSIGAAESAELKKMLRDPRLTAIATGFGFIVWLMDATRLYLIACAVGVHRPFPLFVAISVLYAIIGVLAVTPGGLGIVEGGLTAVMTALGIAPDDALAITLIERLISYALGTAVGALTLMLAGGKQAWRALRSR